MPAWIIALLKWGGSAMAVIGVVALGYVEWSLPAPAAGAAPQPTAAPVTLYFALLIIGAIAAIVGFTQERPKE